MEGKKFAVLLCAEDSEYVKKKYGGYFGVFVRMLAEEGETWDMYRVAAGQFPEDDEIGEYDGFVITGSCNDAHGNDMWICKLLNLLKKLDSMKKKVLGICFGHQSSWYLNLLKEALGPKFVELLYNTGSDTVILDDPHQQVLGRALGGKTGRATSGWDIGVTSVHFSSSKLFGALKMPAALSIIECHRDEVRELPAKAEVIAWSNKTGIEMFRYGDHMMGIQGHPEYTKDILLHLIDRLLQRNFIEESFAQEAKMEVEVQEPDREAWKKLCNGFLKGRL